MRILLACALVLGAMASAVAPVDARNGARYPRYQGYRYQERRGSSAECDRARDVDPSGNYASYPCWAQWALSPKDRGGR